jgi:uncharacterized protein (DUF433 family)
VDRLLGAPGTGGGAGEIGSGRSELGNIDSRSTIKTMMAKEYIEERSGSYYVTGTRISLDSIVYAFHRGESPETICQNFELLRLEQVYGAIAYYLANLAEIDAYLLRQNEKWAEGRREAEPLPADLREKLIHARADLHTTRLS